MTPRPDITVVVPVRNGAEALPGLLDALAAQTGPQFDVIVVDNASTDASAAVAAAHPLRPSVVTESRPGSYAARNAGLAHVRAPVVAFTDVDCRPEPGWLAAGLRALADPAIDLVGGVVEQRLSAAPSVWERYEAALYLDQASHVAEQGFAATANLFVRTDLLRELDGFDATLRSSGDLEFCRRAGNAGHRIAFAEDARVLHVPRASRRETWVLHRRLGAGWHALARRGERPVFWREPNLRIAFNHASLLVSLHAGYVGRRRLIPVHIYAMTARWVGRLTGR